MCRIAIAAAAAIAIALTGGVASAGSYVSPNQPQAAPQGAAPAAQPPVGQAAPVPQQDRWLMLSSDWNPARGTRLPQAPAGWALSLGAMYQPIRVPFAPQGTPALSGSDAAALTMAMFNAAPISLVSLTPDGALSLVTVNAPSGMTHLLVARDASGAPALVASAEGGKTTGHLVFDPVAGQAIFSEALKDARSLVASRNLGQWLVELANMHPDLAPRGPFTRIDMRTDWANGIGAQIASFRARLSNASGGKAEANIALTASPLVPGLVRVAVGGMTALK